MCRNRFREAKDTVDIDWDTNPDLNYNTVYSVVYSVVYILNSTVLNKQNYTELCQDKTLMCKNVNIQKNYKQKYFSEIFCYMFSISVNFHSVQNFEGLIICSILPFL